MKKNLYFKLNILLAFFIYILFFGTTFGDCSNSCKILDGPAPVLTKYLENLSKLSNNFNSEFSKLKIDKSVKNNYGNNKSKIQNSLNQIINWDGYYSLFDFYVIYGTTTEYVPEVWRDYNLLEIEEKSLDKYLKKITSKGLSEQYIDTTKLCNGVDNCFFDPNKSNVIEVLGTIIENHNTVMDYFRLSIVGKKHLFKKQLLFIPNNFEKDFGEYYNEYTSKNCSSCEGGAFDRITKQIDIISNWQKAAKDGMKSWQDAIAMLDGTIDERVYERKERDLLEKEQNRQGASMHASNNVLKNLDKYNESGGYTKENNFITNSFDYIKNSVISQIDSFKYSILENFKKSGKKEIPTNTFTQVEKNLNTTKIIEEQISQMYNRELPFANIQDNSALSLEGRMLELHYDMTQAINNLDSTVKISQKVCNDQGRGLGVCQ